MSLNLRIVIAQQNFLVGAIEANAQKVVDAARQARDELQADLILFPELTLTGYPPEDLLLRPGLHDRVEQALEYVATEISDIAAIIGYPQRTETGVFNAATLIEGGKVLATYHKQVLPNYSVFDEKRYFSPGHQACVVEIQGVKMGLTICEDIWEAAPARCAADAGAQLLLNLNASPFHHGKGEERERVLIQRTAEVGLPVIYCNLVGGQDELVFDGQSLAINGDGKLAVRAPTFVEGLYPVDITVAESGVLNLAGQVEKSLDEEAALYQALVYGVRDYVTKNGFKGAVLGLSGGIDSALVATIAVDALGAENVEVVLMPSCYTADMSNDDAMAEADALGIKRHTIPIEPAFNAFQEMLAETFADTPADVTEENIQARCRGIILMAISNKRGRILLTTGNKSEMAVGYATLYGDMAGGFAPIKDVPKTMVYRLSRYRNTLGQVIPERVITRPPSAELAPDQKDSDSLPDYDVLDPILERYVEQDQCIAEIVAAGFADDLVRRIIALVDRNEYKRRQAPPGVRVSRRAFGRDRRYPITSGYGRKII